MVILSPAAHGTLQALFGLSELRLYELAVATELVAVGFAVEEDGLLKITPAGRKAVQLEQVAPYQPSMRKS